MPSIRKFRVSARRRLVAVLSTLALTAAASVGLMLVSDAAQAAGPCGSPPQAGWSILWNQHYAGAALQVWVQLGNPAHPMVVRFADLQANGKSGVSGEAGYYNQNNALGSTGSIGVAPNGGWCSNVNSADPGQIWGALGLDLPGNPKPHYYHNVYCYQNAGGIACKGDVS